jgi:hypothetical protein
MKTEQTLWTAPGQWQPEPPGKLQAAQLVLIFGSRSILEGEQQLREIRQAYPQAQLLGCSTAGEICHASVLDDSLVCTAIQFDHTAIRGAKTTIASKEDSFQAGATLGEALPREQLVHVLALSDGLHVNGSDLVRGLASKLPAAVKVTGGLSGDGGLFSRTLVIGNGPAKENQIAVIGLYGERLQVGYGSLGGWDPFGPERLITRSKGNILYQFDGASALELYKQYLGKQAEGLPATGLLFPLSLRFEGREDRLVRTILAIDEDEQSMTFAGDVPEGAYAQLMKANFDRLVDGAIGAAKLSYASIGSFPPELALLISCVGRKMILKQRIEEEVEGVQEVLGSDVTLTGFYSYGEISPQVSSGRCELHNQTMTITTFAEK